MDLPAGSVLPIEQPADNLLRRYGMLGQRFRLPLLLIAGSILAFGVERLLLLLTAADRFEDCSGGVISKALLTGMRFDAAIAFMLALPLVAACAAAPAALLRTRVFCWALAVYGGLVAAVLLFTCVADYYFFHEFGLRLNYQVFEYAHYAAVYRTVWEKYPVVWTSLATLGVAVAVSCMLKRWALGHRPSSPWAHGLWPLALVPLAVIAIRGGFGNRPMNTAAAYIGDSPALAQLTLNGLYTLREAAFTMARDRPLSELYALGDPEAAFARSRALLGQPGDEFLNEPENPLRRTTTTGRPRRDYNVVLIVLESISWHYVEALGGDARLMPNLSRLAEEGVLMDHCFSVGHRTAQGLSGTLAGFPDLPGSGVITRPQAEGRFLTLASILRGRGYETIFIQGGQPEFDHKQAFCASNGYSRALFEDEIPCRSFRNVVGWCDGDVLESVDRLARQADRPFLISTLTISFHRPFTIPAGKIEPVEPTHRAAAQLDAIRYCDWAVGQFMAKARQSPYFEKTLFVFTGDHPGGFKQDPMLPGATFRVPFIVYAPAIMGEPRRIGTVCSQSDIAPTILSLLGGSYSHCFFGSSVLDRAPERGLALIRSGANELMLVNGSNDVLWMPPLGAPVKLARLSVPAQLTPQNLSRAAAGAKAKRMQEDATALLQSADVLFRRGSYNMGRGSSRQEQAKGGRR